MNSYFIQWVITHDFRLSWCSKSPAFSGDMGLPDKMQDTQLKFEFQINNEYFVSASTSEILHVYASYCMDILKLFTVYLKFKPNRAFSTFICGLWHIYSGSSFKMFPCLSRTPSSFSEHLPHSGSTRCSRITLYFFYSSTQISCLFYLISSGI